MNAVLSVATSIPITLYDSTGTGRAGLTVTSVARKAGSATTVSATSVTDRSNGDYDVNITFTSVGTWRVTSTATIDGETVPDLTDVNVITAAKDDPAASITALYGALLANLDAAISTRATPANITALQAALSGSTVTVVSPVSLTGDVTLTVGAVATLPWSSDAWDDLTGDTVTFQATKTITDTDVFPVALSVTVGSAGQSTQTLSVTLDADDTALFAEGVQYGYAVTAANAGPLVSGALSAREG